jgi:TonB-linked SusC/RagA family outer membrane protein
MKKNLLSLLLLSFIAFSNAFAQSRTITGKVTSADDGQPLPGVSVKVLGTSTGAQTSAAGTYSLSIPNGAKTLEFSFVGFTTTRVSISGSSTYDVKLGLDGKQLSEVVVTDSYGTQVRKASTSSTSVVTADVLNDKPFTSPIQALQGQVPGLNVTANSGQPGSNIQVRLRGVGSIGLDSNPLYVIDGMIINAGDLSRITPSTNVLSGVNDDDIESVTVLKDASATAIYGSRGANGVVIINTKKGKAGKAQISVDAEVGNTNNLTLPDGGKPLDAAGYSTLTVEGLLNAGVSPTSTTNGIPFYTTSYGLFQPGTNWYQLVTRNALQQQFNVSIRGGNENTKIFTSGGYFKQEATIIASQMNRITGLINIDQTVSKRITVAINLSGSNVNQNSPLTGSSFGGPVGSSFFLRPTQNAFNPDGSLNYSTSGNTNFPGFYNPLFIAANDNKSDSETRILGNLTAKYNIWDKLYYTSTVSIDYTTLEENQFNNPLMGDGKSALGRGIDYYTRYYNWLVRNQLDYKYNIPSFNNFYVDAAIGYEAQRSEGYFISAQSNNYPLTQPLLVASANASSTITGNSSFSNYSFDSFYSRGSINYQDKYVVTGSFRRDGSSRFGTVQPEGNFWSVGGAWNVDQESFFNKQHILTSAKFRSSYGVLGNAGNGGGSLTNYSAQPTATYGSSYAGSPGQNFSTVGNTFLTWESTKEFDAGTDLGFFNDRLTVSFDYYNKNINGLIQAAPISLVTGFSSVTENIGNMRNRGEEFSITGIPVRTKDFKWTTNFNIAFNKNTVTKLANDAAYYNGSFHVQEGSDFYTWSAPAYAGVNPANGEALWYTDATKTATTNAYNLAKLRVDQYQADPKFFGGFSNTFNYKGFSLSADFYYNFGNYVNDSWAFYLTDGTQYTYGKYAYDLNRWTTPGQITDVPKYVAGGGTLADGATLSNSSSFSSRFLYKGDYIRLRNLTAGYNFSNINFIKKYGLTKLYIYGRGTNLWTKTFDSRLPFDPEVGINGTSNLEIPQVRTFTIGLNVGL